MTKSDFGATRGEVYKKLRKYKFDYLAPRAYKNTMIHQGQLNDEARLHDFKMQIEHERRIARLEFNMNYNESVHMDREDHDAKNPYFPCDSDNEEKPQPIIDLTSDSEEEMNEIEYYELFRPNRQQPYDGEPRLE